MAKKLCIHGHFYQPPREDPWFGKIFVEPSAAPMRHWNERITRESYAPLAWARRLDGSGRIADLMNCYEWISFNVGPTLMLWLERQEPELLARIVEADRLSFSRWGHGNAIAQVFHHVILPLASELDKEIEIEWALADFRQRFGRESEGLWLSECAADLATLETVAARGIKFVVLSPHQARLVRQGGEEREVNAASLDYGTPYKIKLPSGKEIAAFFYEADLAQSVAFEGLLSDGEKFWQKIRGVAAAMPGEGSLLTLATDGETYGHHFTFGEMALAYVLDQAKAGRDGLELTNFGAYLAAHPPLAEVELYEPSSWSCAHGVERWRANCGCTTGGHDGWNQEWRAPLREALDFLKRKVDEHYFSAGAGVFKDPRAALLGFGEVLVNRSAGPAFLKKHLSAPGAEVTAWLLLRMQASALSALASCAWFFDELSRIEPVNAMRFALLAMEVMESTGGPEIGPEFEAILGRALSNKAEEGSGRDIFERRVRPSRQDTASMVLTSYLLSYAQGELPKAGKETVQDYPSLSVRFIVDEYGRDKVRGRATIAAPESKGGATYEWSGVLPAPGANNFVSFAEASLEVRAIGGGSGSLRQGSGLARYLLDYLALSMLKSSIARQLPERLAAARQALSTLRPYEEAQQTENLVRLWSEFVAYLPLAVYLSPLPDGAEDKFKELLSRLLSSDAARQEASALLEEAVLEDLAGKKRSDHDIARGVASVAKVFERMDWWKVQNVLWSNGRVNEDFALTAKALGFRM